MPSYRRVALEHRCQIQSYLQLEVPKAEIARALSVHKSTIYREVTRNGQGANYQAVAANRRSRLRFRSCRRNYRICKDLERKILRLLRMDLSPQQISVRIELESLTSVSHQTIYDYIDRNRETLGRYLRRFGRRGAGRYLQRRNRLNSRKLWIQNRPKLANERGRLGDWERDSMLIAQRKLLLVCVDRRSRFVRIAKSDYRIKSTSQITSRILESTGKRIHTITNDNGPEFRDGPNMKIPVYYCDPQKPQQRGTIENTIGLLRQYFKHNTEIDQISNAQIRAVERRINLRPRRCLDYLTPYEVFYGKRVALVS